MLKLAGRVLRVNESAAVISLRHHSTHRGGAGCPALRCVAPLGLKVPSPETGRCCAARLQLSVWSLSKHMKIF